MTICNRVMRLAVRAMHNGAGIHFITARLIKHHTMLTTEHMTPEFKLHLITPQCPLWTANPDDVPFQDPFWAFYWPGGQAIARYILDNPEVISGKRVLDIGSGSGACAIAAAKSGALHVTANDIDPVAITAIKLNCSMNGVDVEVCTSNMIGESCEHWDCILLGDMFYDSGFAQCLFKWLSVLTNKGKSIMIGDPGRHAFTGLKQNVLVELARYRMPHDLLLENNGLTEASVWKMSNPE